MTQCFVVKKVLLLSRSIHNRHYLCCRQTSAGNATPSATSTSSRTTRRRSTTTWRQACWPRHTWLQPAHWGPRARWVPCTRAWRRQTRTASGRRSRSRSYRIRCFHLISSSAPYPIKVSLSCVTLVASARSRSSFFSQLCLGQPEPIGKLSFWIGLTIFSESRFFGFLNLPILTTCAPTLHICKLKLVLPVDINVTSRHGTNTLSFCWILYLIKCFQHTKNKTYSFDNKMINQIFPSFHIIALNKQSMVHFHCFSCFIQRCIYTKA